MRRKNFLPTFILTLALWLLLGGIIYFIDPGAPGIILLFLTICFFSLLFTFSLLFGNKRRGFLTSISLTLFLILSYFGVGNILNFILIAGLGVTIELYLARK